MQTFDTLWAPWRMAYIQDNGKKNSPPKVEVGAGADANCFLCQGVFDKSHDKERLVLRRTDFTVSVLNCFPYNNGHILVAPCSHCGKLSGLAKEVKSALLDEIDRWVEILQRKMTPDGFNIGINIGQSAGAGLPGHLHWHIVPRWNGDANYITTVGSSKVIPQALEALWEELAPLP